MKTGKLTHSFSRFRKWSSFGLDIRYDISSVKMSNFENKSASRNESASVFKTSPGGSRLRQTGSPLPIVKCSMGNAMRSSFSFKTERPWLTNRFMEAKRQLSAKFKLTQERNSSVFKSSIYSSKPEFVSNIENSSFLSHSKRTQELSKRFTMPEFRFKLENVHSSKIQVEKFVQENGHRLDSHEIRPRIAVFKTVNDCKLHIAGGLNKNTNARKEKTKTIHEAILLGKEDGFEVQEFAVKGRGVVTRKAFGRGDFVLEYHGELIDHTEAVRRETAYAQSEEKDAGCYLYYFKCADKKYCIDATKESGRLGRLVNHSRKGGNLKVRSLLVQGSPSSPARPRVVLFASRDIEPGEELLYDYGDRRKQVLESNPWLAQ